MFDFMNINFHLLTLNIKPTLLCRPATHHITTLPSPTHFLASSLSPLSMTRLSHNISIVPSNFIPLSLHASLSINHFLSSAFAPLGLSVSTSFDVDAHIILASGTPPSSPSTISPPGLDLVIDLSNYSIPQPLISLPFFIILAPRMHPMVLHP